MPTKSVSSDTLFHFVGRTLRFLSAAVAAHYSLDATLEPHQLASQGLLDLIFVDENTKALIEK